MKLALNRPYFIWESINEFISVWPYFQLLTLAMTLALFVGISVMNVYILHENKLLNDRAIKMQVELSDLAALGHEIQLEEQGLNRYDRIKLIAEKRLGLTDVKPHQIVKE